MFHLLISDSEISKVGKMRQEEDQMRVALYARVSTNDQHSEVQVHAMKAYADARGCEIVDSYVDHGVSGAKERRVELDRMMADARRRRFDAVVCTKLDRLARSVRHLTTIGEELEALGVDLIVLDQAIDTSTSAGRLLFGVLACIAQFERDLIRERTRAGIAAARRRGKRIGRPRVHVPLARVNALLSQGASVASTARDLGVSRATLQRLLKTVSRSGAASLRPA
jgi:DNA invertase Pin-like site-specific DNA recombinase